MSAPVGITAETAIGLWCPRMTVLPGPGGKSVYPG